MGRRQRQGSERMCASMIVLVLLSLVGRISSLSVTVNDVECVSKYVLYEGDMVSGNFVVVDHDIFWTSDHPGIDFTVSDLGFDWIFLSDRVFVLRGLSSFIIG
jgi:hypothetical protein